MNDTNKYIGWVKYHRKILVDPVFQSLTSKQKHVWLTLPLLENYATGEIVTNLSTISQFTGYSKQTIAKILAKFESLNWVTYNGVDRKNIVIIFRLDNKLTD
ncbi:MAG: hypothetical protein FWG64_00875 [Firmicutes bacterium]|nr:hypothetical protein [Bacillota bacterium]